MSSVADYVNFRQGLGLNLPHAPMPLEIRPQKRKDKATRSMHEKSICGADTETINGRVWLFSTEFGVWEIDSMADLLNTLFNRNHRSKWKSGRGDGRKAKRGYSVKQFFFWNLQYDAQAIMHLMEFDDVVRLLNTEDVELEVDLGATFGVQRFVFRYLEGKSLTITPKKWFIGQYKVGVCRWWDISQFFGKRRLNDTAKHHLNESKVELCFDGTSLDVSRLGEAEYRDLYREDIETYAVQDAVLAGRLARLKLAQYIEAGVRFIMPYSLANVAQRALLDTCDIPVIQDMMEHGLERIVQAANSSYLGGWFEVRGTGYYPEAQGIDLASAYPYVMYHLADCTEGAWIHGDGPEGWWARIEGKRPFQMAFAEAFVVFDEGLDWFPLCTKNEAGTVVSPRVIRGWFTAEELLEARQWPHSTFLIGEWVFHDEDGSEKRPFKPFIERFYEMKQNSKKGTAAYEVAKVQLNSIYGKTRQAVDGKTGKMWNPAYASYATGATRSRLCELIRLNGFSALSVATDGVIFPKDDLTFIPERPAPAPYNLGQWELEEGGELLVVMSGVYSIREATGQTKTTFRGSASYFLRGRVEGGLFAFCEEHSDAPTVSMTVNKPWSAREAVIRHDGGLINLFEPRRFSMSALGDSTKRLWGRRMPRVFGDLLGQWWDMHPHQNID